MSSSITTNFQINGPLLVIHYPRDPHNEISNREYSFQWQQTSVTEIMLHREFASVLQLASNLTCGGKYNFADREEKFARKSIGPLYPR